jgi:hypothetical protein
MTTYHQQAGSYSTTSGTVRPSFVALVGGGVLAVLLIAAALPLLAAAGLWLLGVAALLIGAAFIANRRAETAVWDSAIAAQGLGLLGLALLFISSIAA